MSLRPLEGALRIRLDEQDWVAASRGVPGLPDWAQPVSSTRTGAPVDLEAADVPVDADVRAAVGLRGSALLEVEVASVGGERATLGVLWSDGRVCSSLVRGVDVVPAAGPAGAVLRPGIEVSAFDIEDLLDEVRRLVPDAPVLIETTEAVVPEELTIALAKAMRTGDRTTVEVLCAELGLAEPPAVVAAAVRGVSGSLTLTARSVGRDGASVGSWLRCDAGWVELVRTPDAMVRHTPCSPEDIVRRLLSDLTGRLGVALQATAGATESSRRDGVEGRDS
ncbi:hypothetical protein [Cellulomonas sp. URHD0024]|uniref:hypothetical protein n=1 Tax=Cellulomonas sp. URHD0024 TaxID=1302620 RepID=UPI0012DC9098|nr:hypothetical protein [Cellulomonas sp. URHD0024]